jgi:hypothetical protein
METGIMQTLRVTERTGKDGVLHINLPVGTPDSDFEVLLVIQPKPGNRSTDVCGQHGWPSGYFDNTFGSITDETFERPPQGELPTAVKLD